MQGVGGSRLGSRLGSTLGSTLGLGVGFFVGSDDGCRLGGEDRQLLESSELNAKTILRPPAPAPASPFPSSFILNSKLLLFSNVTENERAS